MRRPVILALFDLDNTLLAGDSDYEWGRFLIDKGAVDRDAYEAANRDFYEQYKAGTLDIYEFARFAFRPLVENPLERLEDWRAEFFANRIQPLILPGARELLTRHREQGHELLIITATNRFVTEPVAAELGVTHLLATEPRFEQGRFTGEIDGVPCFREGKVTRLQAWMAEHGADLRDSWFYSDSHNDLPLLQRVEHPVVVDGDVPLTDHALAQGWPMISLRFRDDEALS
jgi:HAD superfamily hydrolase (TIGR01490 family)